MRVGGVSGAVGGAVSGAVGGAVSGAVMGVALVGTDLFFVFVFVLSFTFTKHLYTYFSKLSFGITVSSCATGV